MTRKTKKELLQEIDDHKKRVNHMTELRQKEYDARCKFEHQADVLQEEKVKLEAELQMARDHLTSLRKGIELFSFMHCPNISLVDTNDYDSYSQYGAILSETSLKLETLSDPVELFVAYLYRQIRNY